MVFREQKAHLGFLTKFQVIVLASEPASSCLASFNQSKMGCFFFFAFFWCHRQSWGKKSCKLIPAAHHTKADGQRVYFFISGCFYFSTHSASCWRLDGVRLQLQPHSQQHSSWRTLVLDSYRKSDWFTLISACSRTCPLNLLCIRMVPIFFCSLAAALSSASGAWDPGESDYPAVLTDVGLSFGAGQSPTAVFWSGQACSITRQV